MRICSIVGARPQFVKLSVVAHAATSRGAIHRIIHTGQHYDTAMSSVFFEELNIPAPDFDLGVGSGPHGAQTGEMMKRLEPVLASANPDWVVIYGDTNSTLAGAVVAAKLMLPIAHVEAGLRSFRRGMPEEINRVVADRISDVLFCPTSTAMDNLGHEGMAERAILSGDVMYDAVLRFRGMAEQQDGCLAETWLPGRFALATVHRAENTDDADRLRAILGTLDRIARDICPVVLPLHPRTRRLAAALGWEPREVSVIEPVSYLQMLLLESRAGFILTDSGGVQKEAYFLRVPCVTLRDETEWTETLANGCNILAGACPERAMAAARAAATAGPWKAIYGDGHAGDRIVAALNGTGR